MKKALLILAAATSAFAQQQQNPAPRVADDAKVLDRVAEASKRDLPQGLLERIVNEDIDLLRGKRADGTYQYASYEKMEATRVNDSFSIQPERKDTMVQIAAPFAYRLIIAAPSRRMVVTRNKRVYVDRVELEWIPQGDSSKKIQTVKVEGWIDPGTSKSIDLDDVGRQVTARVYTKADESGYGNIVLTLIQARVFDDPNSPYHDAVESEKAILRAVRANDIPSIRAMAQRVSSTLQPTSTTTAVAAVPVRPPASSTMEVTPSKSDAEVLAELQAIEDLLTGNESERRQGLDKLHQLVRRLRAPSR